MIIGTIFIFILRGWEAFVGGLFISYFFLGRYPFLTIRQELSSLRMSTLKSLDSDTQLAMSIVAISLVIACTDSSFINMHMVSMMANTFSESWPGSQEDFFHGQIVMVFIRGFAGRHFSACNYTCVGGPQRVPFNFFAIQVYR